MREEKFTDAKHSFEHLLLMLQSIKTSCNTKLKDLLVVARTIVDAVYDRKSLFKQCNALAELNRLQYYFVMLHIP